MDEGTINLLKELQALKNSSDPIREILAPLPNAIQAIKDDMSSLRRTINEIKADVHGTKEEPSLGYRVQQIEKRLILMEATHAKNKDLQGKVEDIQLWKNEKEASAKAIKKMTVETVVKTIIPWLFALLSGAYIAFTALA